MFTRIEARTNERKTPYSEPKLNSIHDDLLQIEESTRYFSRIISAHEDPEEIERCAADAVRMRDHYLEVLEFSSQTVGMIGNSSSKLLNAEIARVLAEIERTKATLIQTLG